MYVSKKKTKKNIKRRN